jgi:hypothetical protein
MKKRAIDYDWHVYICIYTYRYGMSSIYPLVMSWPGESGLGMDTGTTAHIVIGGCIGESLVPIIIGFGMQVSR